MSTLAEKIAAARNWIEYAAQRWPEYKDELELELHWVALLDVAEAALDEAVALEDEFGPIFTEEQATEPWSRFVLALKDALNRLDAVLPEPTEEQT